MAMPSENDTYEEPVPRNKSAAAGSENFCERLEAYIEDNPFRAIVIALLSGIAVAKLLL